VKIDLATLALNPQPVSGWVLPVALRFDRAAPGYLAYLLTSGTLRRQNSFLAMSVVEDKGEEFLATAFDAAGLANGCLSSNPLIQIAHCLINARAEAIWKAICSPEAAASVHLLHRVGNGPLSRPAYRGLIALMSRSELRDRGSLLSHDFPISEITIEAALSMPTDWMRPELISRIQSASQLSQLRCALDLVMSLIPHDRHVEVCQSLENLSPATPLGMWLVRLLERVPSFPVVGPLPDDEEVRLLNSPEALKEAGSRFRNCLKSKIPLVALGRVVYYEWLHSPHIVELQVLSRQQHLFIAVYAPKGQSVTADTLRTISAKFEKAGALVPAQFAEFRQINQCASLLGVYDWGNPDADEDDDIIDIAILEDAA
jgi:hypothetical protein